MKEKTKVSLAKLTKLFFNLLKNNPDFHGKVVVNFNDGNLPNVKIEKTILLDGKQTDYKQI